MNAYTAFFAGFLTGLVSVALAVAGGVWLAGKRFDQHCQTDLDDTQEPT